MNNGKLIKKEIGQRFPRIFFRQSGSVLIFALWVVTFLSIFAACLGLKLRQRTALLSRLEHRSQLHLAAEAGMKKAVASLRQDIQRNNFNYTPQAKQFRHNNSGKFKDIDLNHAVCQVSYDYKPEASLPSTRRYGFVDEESKMNVNAAERADLRRLIKSVVAMEERQADNLVEAIIDWREAGRAQLTGFYSDDYYYNLEYPYKPKNAPFETLEELLLVQGLSQGIYQQMLPFITVYGDGRVNVNTAPLDVLASLGWETDLVEKFLSVRRGEDGVEGTADDYVFHNTYDIASEMKNFVKMDDGEIKQIDHLNAAGKIKTNSDYYFIRSRACRAERPQEGVLIGCVYNARQNKIEYWREKYEYFVDRTQG